MMYLTLTSAPRVGARCGTRASGRDCRAGRFRGTDDADDEQTLSATAAHDLRATPVFDTGSTRPGATQRHPAVIARQFNGAPSQDAEQRASSASFHSPVDDRVR